MNRGQGAGGPAEDRAALQRAAMPDFPRWLEMVTATGGCSHPIRLVGERMSWDAWTGELIESYSTSDEPTGYLLTACKNRRSSRCPSCAETYRRDTYHLILAGLRGGKGVPDEVDRHPRVFVTLTAPSFGAVHAQHEDMATRCRPRRERRVCVHGRALGCGARHAPGDPLVGQPLCLDCYDYVGAVLWNAHAGKLWHRLGSRLHAALAMAAGLSRAELRKVLRVSFAKVAEYQSRGLVHFHAVIRLDGPMGPESLPPDWAAAALLEQAVSQAVSATSVELHASAEFGGSQVLKWGRQLDIQTIYIAAGLDGISDRQVARYIAKYATKGAESTGTVDRPIQHLEEIRYLDVSEHVRRMIWTCFELGDCPEHAALRLRQWAHMLGYRGHFSTKSRRYSTTLRALRGARAEQRRMATGELRELAPSSRETVAVKRWRYAGSGYLTGETYWAEAVRRQLASVRGLSGYRAG